MLYSKGLSITCAAAALLVAAGALDARAGDMSAFDQSGQAERGPAVGVGVICDTSEQAEHFITRRAAGEGVTPAVQNVNAEAQQPRACGIATIAFTIGKTVDTKAVNGKLMKIVQVNVIAGYNGANWQPVNTVQFAIVETPGYAI
jgi:hypothetical protein